MKATIMMIDLKVFGKCIKRNSEKRLLENTFLRAQYLIKYNNKNNHPYVYKFANIYKYIYQIYKTLKLK